MHGNGVLDTLEIAKRVLPDVNYQQQDQREHHTDPEQCCRALSDRSMRRNREDQACSKSGKPALWLSKLSMACFHNCQS
jgi:hypothetical protein